MSDSVRPQRWQPTRLHHPWDSPGKNTGVGCHFLLQCMIVKSESEVAQSCPILSDPMDCSPPGSSIHGISQARALEWGAIADPKNHSIKAGRAVTGIGNLGKKWKKIWTEIRKIIELSIFLSKCISLTSIGVCKILKEITYGYLFIHYSAINLCWKSHQSTISLGKQQKNNNNVTTISFKVLD